jgi:hypothetical protein
VILCSFSRAFVVLEALNVAAPVDDSCASEVPEIKNASELLSKFKSHHQSEEALQEYLRKGRDLWFIPTRGESYRSCLQDVYALDLTLLEMWLKESPQNQSLKRI